MKIIYDTDHPEEKRLCFIGKNNEPYYGFRCFKILLDDGVEVAEIGKWGNQKERKAILEKYKG